MLSNFLVILEYIKKQQKHTDQIVSGIDEKYSEIVKSLKESGQEDLEDLRTATVEFVEDIEKKEDENEARISELDQRLTDIEMEEVVPPKEGKPGKDGKDGKTPVKGVDYFDGKDPDVTSILAEAKKHALASVKELIPVVNPITGEVVKKALEELHGDERLEIGAVKDLWENLEKMSGRIRGISTPDWWTVHNAVLQPNNSTGWDVLVKGTDRYLNFNTTTGTSGYGFRDNSGSMEYKDDSGSWVAFSSLGGVTDHGALTGLADDDHTQYHTDARGDARYLQILNNLSDLDDVPTARTNLGLQSAALEKVNYFLQVLNNLSDLANVATARTNLGLVAGGSGDIWAYRTLDDTISATWTFSDSSNGGIIMNNSVELFYGSLKEFSTSFDKADASANFLKHDMPAQTANTVPVEAWGIGIKDVDLALFDGQTNPLNVIFKDDRTDYQYWGWNDTESAGIYGSSSRLMFLTGTDQIKFESSLGLNDLRAMFRASLGRIARFELGEGDSSMFYMEHNGIYNRSALFTTAWNNYHMIFGDSNNRSANWNVPVQDNPTFIVTARTSPSVEKGWMVAIDIDGIHGGRREGADYSTSSGRMSRDNAPRDLYFTAAGAWASATVNLDGADVILGGGPSTGAGTDGVVKSRSIFEIIDGLEERFYDVGNSNYVGFKAPALTANQIWTLPAVDGSADDIMKTDGSGNLDFATPTVEIDISFDTYDAEPSRASESNIHGGLASLATGQPLDSSPTDLVVTKGIGKMVIVINAGSDISGEITVTGETIDRNTGASTPGDTDVITVDALTTDGSTTDSNGNIVHVFTGAYITSKWFTGTVTLSTTDLTLTDVDVYHCSFEQFNDQSDLLLKSFDANIYTTHVNAEFDAYLHTIHVTGDKCNIDCEAELHVGADGETAIANKYWRLRRGNIDEALDGTTDGFWVDVHYSNSPAYVEDVSLKIWVTKTAPLILT